MAWTENAPRIFLVPMPWAIPLIVRNGTHVSFKEEWGNFLGKKHKRARAVPDAKISKENDTLFSEDDDIHTTARYH